jgi:hypothetical protein
LTVLLIGLARAKACSQPGRDCRGTNAVLAKTSGKLDTNPAV